MMIVIMTTVMIMIVITVMMMMVLWWYFASGLNNYYHTHIIHSFVCSFIHSCIQSLNFSPPNWNPPGFSEKQIPCLQVNFIVTRPMGYFLIQFYIPSVLLVVLSFVSFWISVDAVVARVNIGLMSVLNLVTQSTGSRNQLPKVGEWVIGWVSG